MLAEDLSTFFNVADFAAPATAYDAHGIEHSFGVIFDAPVAAQFGGMVADETPSAICQSADVAGLTWDSGITIAGTAWMVTAATPDGTGVTRLSLREI